MLIDDVVSIKWDDIQYIVYVGYDENDSMPMFVPSNAFIKITKNHQISVVIPEECYQEERIFP